METGKSSFNGRRLVLILLVGAVVCVGVYAGSAYWTKPAPPTPPIRLKTGGTSAAALMVENGWRTAYRMQKGVEVDYESIGSTKGLDQMIAGQLPIAFTHAPLSDVQKKTAADAGNELIQVPVVVCAVVPIYNLKKMKDKAPLKFNGDVLAGIFLGKIEKWNDPELKKLNEDADLPDLKITVVHRSDSSGTTFLFTEYLAATSAWKEKFGKAGSEVKWPVGVGKSRSFALAQYVQEVDGAIGYTDLVYAFLGGIQHGAVQNKDKSAFIHPDVKHVTAAMKQEMPEVKDDLSFDLTNKAGADSYPICGAIWAVCIKSQPATTRASVLNFLTWMTHDGQRYASTAYAPLPEELVKRVDEKLQLLKGDVAQAAAK